MGLVECPAFLLALLPSAGAAGLSPSPGWALGAGFLFRISSCLLSMTLNFAARGCLAAWVGSDGGRKGLGASAEGVSDGCHKPTGESLSPS